MTQSEINDKLNEEMKKQGRSLYYMAKGINSTHTQVRDMLSGKTNTSVRFLCALCETLGLEIRIEKKKQ